jgi:uncharacterized protein
MIVSVYASILALLFVGLSLKTVWIQRSLHIGLSGAGSSLLMRASRAHANFAEHIPLCLLLFYHLETRRFMAPDSTCHMYVFVNEQPGGLMPSWLIHHHCLLLLLGKCFHIYGLSRLRGNSFFRAAGTHVTECVLFASVILFLISLRFKSC